MLKYGTSYLVTPRTGFSNVYRSGKLAGTHPEVGYHLSVPGVCSAIAGTELAAHALAEVYKNVVSHRRLWVLTEAEVDEHLQILRKNNDELMAAFPYSTEEQTSVDAHHEKYSAITAEGERNIRRQLMNVSTRQYVIERPSLPRPAEFPSLDEEPETSIGMRL
jgi:hypothetical protein